MSEETFSASDALIVPKLRLLGVLVLLRAELSMPGVVDRRVGLIRPSSSAASAVIGLNVEPVG